MGALHAGRCYGSAADAAHAMWSGVEPVIASASPPSVSTVEFFAEGWHLVTREGGQVVASVAVPTVAFAGCEPGEAFSDGVQLAWGVVAVWAAVWAIRYGIGRAITR